MQVVASIVGKKFISAGNTLGSPAQNARARAWGFFELGLALGNSALFYDSAAVVYPATPTIGAPRIRSGSRTPSVRKDIAPL